MDPNSKNEAIRLILSHYNIWDKPFRDLYEYCESVSNYDEYYEFGTLAVDIEPLLSEYAVYNDRIKEEITRFGLEDNAEINAAANSLSVLLGVTGHCMQEKADIYGQ